jgi:DNA polymerase-3 subunit alpha
MDGLPGNRAQKNAVLEDTIRIGQRLQKDLRRGQKVLFGNAGDRARGPSLPAVEEWPTLDLLRYEKEALGFYMSGHPLLERRDTIEQLRTCCVQDLANQPADSGHVLGGMIASVKRTTSKRGDAMARIEFEDLSGKIEAVVFPNPYQQYGPLLQAGTIVFLRGTVDRSMERLGFRVDEVCPLDEAPGRLSGSVTLRLDRLGLTEETLKDLYAICQRHKGQAAVQLEMVMPDRRRLLLRTGRDITVRAGAEFMGEVDRLLGPSRARLSAAPYDGNGGRRRWGRQWAEKATGE